MRKFVIATTLILFSLTGLVLARGAWARNVTALQVEYCVTGNTGTLLPVNVQALSRDEWNLWIRCPELWRQPEIKRRSGSAVPADIDEAYYIGQVLAANGASSSALETWRSFPSLARLFTFKCTRDLNDRACDVALNDCTRATEIDSGFGDAFAELGRVYTYCFRRYDDAAQVFARAETLGADSGPFWLAYAHVLNIQGQFLAAARMTDDHNLVGALADAIRAGGARAEGQHARAVQLYERAIAASPKDPWLYHGLASTLYEMGRKEQATKIWQEALAIEPDFEPALKGLASLNSNGSPK